MEPAENGAQLRGQRSLDVVVETVNAWFENDTFLSSSRMSYSTTSQRKVVQQNMYTVSAIPRAGVVFFDMSSERRTQRWHTRNTSSTSDTYISATRTRTSTPLRGTPLLRFDGWCEMEEGPLWYQPRCVVVRRSHDTICASFRFPFMVPMSPYRSRTAHALLSDYFPR